MPAEAATDKADVIYLLDVAADGADTDTQCHSELFSTDFTVFLDECDNSGV